MPIIMMCVRARTVMLTSSSIYTNSYHRQLLSVVKHHSDRKGHHNAIIEGVTEGKSRFDRHDEPESNLKATGQTLDDETTAQAQPGATPPLLA